MAPPPDPAALAAHQRLFVAADNGDVPAFKALLTPASVALLDQHLRALERLDRPPGVRSLRWKDLLRMHAELPAAARDRAPYPLVDGKLNIAGHPDAPFFSAVRDSVREVAGE